MKVHNNAAVIAVNSIVAIMEMDRNLQCRNDVAVMVSYNRMGMIPIGEISRIDSGLPELALMTISVRAEFSQYRGNVVYIQAQYQNEGEEGQVEPELAFHFDDLINAAKKVGWYLTTPWWVPSKVAASVEEGID